MTALHPFAAPMRPLRISAYTATSAVGTGKAALVEALATRRSGLRRNDFGSTPLDTWIGRVGDLEAAALPASLASWECRNNRLAWLALQADGFLDTVQEARERHGADRVAVVMGTSTSSMGQTEDAYAALDERGLFPAHTREPKVHTPHSIGAFVQEALGLTGPAVTVATACSSSAKVFAQAERLLRLGLVDAAVVGGVDTLCGSILFGFNALSLVSTQPCRPFDVARNGLSLGEAGGFALLERGSGGLQLWGYGESSDAHHMSTPHPEGLGAERALDEALARAAVPMEEIDYLNLHGTASQKNDEVEAALVARKYSPHTHASSTKGWAGHTLGAAGILEAVISLWAVESGWMPGTLNTEDLDPLCGPQIRRQDAQTRVRCAVSHSFGFGGNNCVLIFGQGRAVS
ncbi:MAG: beta-ketoacyl-[acyl-carrier-protein] synthase family protein [Pseudomonadota bacterium]